MLQRVDTAVPVELQGVTKTYGDTTVLEQIDLELAEGESLVLLGHNGAGKTTLFKLLLGLVRPSAGQVRVFGEDPGTAAAVARRAALGYLPESIAFDEAMTGHELLKFYAGLKGVGGAACSQLLARVGIAEAADRRISTWSKGMRQRLGLAQAMLGSPRILLLDEPTSGLDPVLRSTLYEIVESLRADGVAVLISSHALSEVEAHADRIAILQQGRLLACGTVQALREQAALPVYLRLACTPQMAASIANQFDSRAVVRCVGAQQVEIECAYADKMNLLRDIAGLGDAVLDVDIKVPGLDELYAHFTSQVRA
jgi:Cu-processing system ATP-binding protein